MSGGITLSLPCPKGSSAVPLQRSSLRVDHTSRAVRAARVWVGERLSAVGREDLVWSAEVAVSELLSNALLHGEPPIVVQMGGTRDHPRVEVSDGSTQLPAMPDPRALEALTMDLGDDEPLLTIGRGLDLVSRFSEAWGVDLGPEGKILWFAPSAEAQETGVPGEITGERVRAPEPRGAVLSVQLLGVPVAKLSEFERHQRELAREVALLALAHEAEYPLAKTISDVFDSLRRDVRPDLGEQLRQLRDAGVASSDMEVTVSRRAAAGLGRFVELLSLADAFCVEQRLLTLARTPEQIAFQNWWFGEISRQLAGEAPTAWNAGSWRLRA
jgi:anti-sigma regulatory factor (Ser/Thr protein kinase)